MKVAFDQNDKRLGPFSKLIIMFMNFYYVIKEAQASIKLNQELEREKQRSLDDRYNKIMDSLIDNSRYSQLLKEYNALIERINEKGGEKFLREGVIPSKIQNQFTQEEIKTLINLCHPDKHNSKQSAKEITQKLLSLRV